MTISIPMLMLILAYSPLNFTFPWWLWAIAILEFSVSNLFKAVGTAIAAKAKLVIKESK